ncbi:hypothetical protein K7X08_009525 [Anisodus acutangulus]|uniref:Uncharacterized protein n=1 Tax=Anisodus acutangulus TaxID=402998 RepID=A0A9Q1MZP1_9SOLA|nr:hypothetical protein K7X08_009525 [Anisodus acutangulus]
MECGRKRKISTDDDRVMAMLCNSQPQLLGSENMACCRKRKISTDDHILIDVKELEKDNKILRAAMLKERYANVIIKSQQQILGEAFNGEDKKKKVKLWEKQLQAKSQRQKDREAAQIAIASIKRTVDFEDDYPSLVLQVVAKRELYVLISRKNFRHDRLTLQFLYLLL